MSRETRDDDGDDRTAEKEEARDIERYGIDERELTPLGLTVPGVGLVPDAVIGVLRYGLLGLWIALFALKAPEFALPVMFVWIGASSAYGSHRKRLRRERRRQIQAHIAARGGLAAGTGTDALGPADAPAALASAPPAPGSASPGAAERPVEVPASLSATPAERALTRTLRRVETSERFERRDAVLVGELADVLFPLLAKVAEPGADPLVRQDVEKIATEHLPDSVDAYLALPAERVRTSRNSAGRTPLEELRTQLDLLLTGCEQLQESVLRADVARQQEQSRFLEQKFRPSGLDL